MSLQYGVGICLLTTVPVTMKYTMRAMVVACAHLCTAASVCMILTF